MPKSQSPEAMREILLEVNRPGMETLVSLIQESGLDPQELKKMIDTEDLSGDTFILVNQTTIKDFDADYQRESYIHILSKKQQKLLKQLFKLPSNQIHEIYSKVGGLDEVDKKEFFDNHEFSIGDTEIDNTYPESEHSALSLTTIDSPKVAELIEKDPEGVVSTRSDRKLKGGGWEPRD